VAVAYIDGPGKANAEKILKDVLARTRICPG
jgi:hypothetical protein